MNKLEIKKGQKFNMLTVIEESERIKLPSGQVNRVFLCRCDCGNSKKVRLLHLKRSRIKSCGCLVTGNRPQTDEEKYIRKIWRAIQYRTSPNYFEKHLYFEKGIKVCDEWLNNYDSFRLWAIKNDLKKGMQIDRIDGDKGYNPKNCRVVSPKENSNNRVNTHYVDYKGQKIALGLLLDEKKLTEHYYTIRARIKRGWSAERAIDQPIRKSK